MKVLNIIGLVICLLALAFGGLMFWKAMKSQSMKPKVGLVDGKLKSCGPKPNCVSSFADKDSSFYIEPISAGNIEVIWDNLNLLLPDLGLKVISSTESYIHAIDTTSLMKFVDDVEFLLDETNGLLHMRSASRVGYSDMGANKKRLNKIKKELLGKNQ